MIPSTLTPAQRAALLDYAYRHGRTWKAALRLAWEAGSAWGELQELRNTHGPTWLAHFRLTYPCPDCDGTGRNTIEKGLTRCTHCWGRGSTPFPTKGVTL